MIRSRSSLVVHLRPISTTHHYLNAKLLRGMSLRNTLVPRAAPPKEMVIQLTDVEKDVCELVDGCAKYLESEKGVTTTCRVAGGWVRDKLLGSQSNDMDIALSDMMGLTFAEHLKDFANSKGIEMGRITKVERRPDQSKHLETATFKVFGLDLDLVNLRSEEYAEGSRIPTGVTFGTPLEDALRRDITINALFYNVHTQEVEDFTGKGLADLRDGLIRTPMPPRETFLDDPLRVLRCIRFASRFGFEVLPEVKEAIKDSVVQKALVAKVARDRVGDEITKMIQGRNPLRSAQLICELDLYHSVFSIIPIQVKAELPERFSTSVPEEALAAASILHALISPETSDLLEPHESLTSIVHEDSYPKARLYLASLLLPFMGLTYTDSKKKTQTVVTTVIRESVKLGTQNHYLDGIPVLFASIPVLKSGLEQHSREPLDRAKLGLLLRNKSVHCSNTGNHWSTSLLFSLVIDLVAFYNVRGDQFHVDEASRIISLYNSFITRIIELDLQNDVDSKPILTGKEVLTAFGVGKIGPWVGKVLEDVVEWQLSNPTGSKDECALWLRSRGQTYYVSEDEKKAGPIFKRARRD